MSNLFSSYLKEVYIPQAIKNIVDNSFWFSQGWFEIVQPGNALHCDGPHINTVIDYSATSNAEKYVQGAPMPTPSTINDIRAYFVKDFFQESVKVFGDTMAMLGGGAGSNVQLDAMKKSIDQGLQNLVTVSQSAFLTDLSAQVDSSTAYSDASLSRATYGLASYEVGSIGTLEKADLTDMVEALADTTYGQVDPADLCWLLSQNNLTNISNLSGIAYSEFKIDAQNMAAADLGNRQRTLTFEGIPLVVVPGFSTSEIMLVKRSSLKVMLHKPFEVVDKPVQEWADQKLATVGANLVVLSPRQNAKITGVTP